MKKLKLSQKIQTTLSLVICALAGAMCIVCFAVFMGGCANAQTSKEQSNPDAIIFEFSNIDSCFYSWEDGCFIINYNDPDVFDYNAMAWRSGREEWYGDYVSLDIEDSLVGQFLVDYHKYIELLHGSYQENWIALDKLSARWGIICWDESSESYELIKMEDEEWWFK